MTTTTRGLAARRAEHWRREAGAHQRLAFMLNGTNIAQHAERAARRARRHLRLWQALSRQALPAATPPITETAAGFVSRPRQAGMATERIADTRHEALAEVAEFLRPASYYRARPHQAPPDLARLQEWLTGQGIEITGWQAAVLRDAMSHRHTEQDGKP